MPVHPHLQGSVHHPFHPFCHERYRMQYLFIGHYGIFHHEAETVNAPELIAEKAMVICEAASPSVPTWKLTAE